ncbi:apolipoprotein N-acyltransferase [uncultured Sunxiuqinia sp.]|uniref:apolipoprotein N-acyltransferase n=1 Tax=uncultured Sunxiuqinia sp. TaxID=1573825 RepID=UPI00262E0CEA|nr:apolipoprotein N-acyltransferase [uncultured Sunxiuqinia sp.]
MKKYQAAFLPLLSGVLLSLPWLELFPGWILLGALVPLLFVENRLAKKEWPNTSFDFLTYAFLGFLVWNLITCWWIAYAAPVGMLLIVTLNALLMATVWWLFHQMKQTFNTNLGYLSLVVIWLAFEYLHFNWDMEWPWLTLGNGLANEVKLIQWYEFTGVLGGSLWILVSNLILFQLLNKVFQRRWLPVVSYACLLLLVALVPMLLSSRQYENYNEKGEAYQVIVLQPNIDPYHEKFVAGTETHQLETLVQLTDSLLTPATDFVLGPETALQPLVENDLLGSDSQLAPFYERVTANPRLNFVFGATTRKYYAKGETPSETARQELGESRSYDLYNSALLVNGESEVQIYHKSKLVSGTEKMPFSKYFSFVEKYLVDLGGTTGSLGRHQDQLNLNSTADVSVAPLICFESVFGEYLGQSVQAGAELVFILTNDGWWKGAAGYRQHLSYARLRAIEARRSIARSANTGISALINQRGDIVSSTDWWTKTAIEGELKANREITSYVRYGDFIGRISAFVTVLFLLALFVRKQTKNSY